MLHRAIEMANGSISIVSPNPRKRLKKDETEGEYPGKRLVDETEAEHLERYYHQMLASTSSVDTDGNKIPSRYAGLPYEDINSVDLPQDRSKRNKWRRKQGGGIHVDHSIPDVAVGNQ